MPNRLTCPDPIHDGPLTGITILLVEDSRFAADILRNLCRKSGGRLRRAEDLASARAHLRVYRPEVLIVDMGLPDGDGLSLIAEVQNALHPPIILATSGDPLARERALAAGANAFFDKPLSQLAQFHNLILAHLPGHQHASLDQRHLIGDPLALRDDLQRAADILATDLDGQQTAFVTGFVAGLAQTARDPHLAHAASAAHQEARHLPRLAGIIAVRLGKGAAPFAIETRR